MSKFRITVQVDFDRSTALRRLSREEQINDMREGRRLRAQTFRAKKGKGSYSRKAKHKEF